MNEMQLEIEKGLPQIKLLRWREIEIERDKISVNN